MRGGTIARLLNQGASAAFDAYEIGLVAVFFGCFGCLSILVKSSSDALPSTRSPALENSPCKQARAIAISSS